VSARSVRELYFEFCEKVSKREHQKVKLKRSSAILHRERKECNKSKFQNVENLKEHICELVSSSKLRRCICEQRPRRQHCRRSIEG
jgi:hypothetical protein